VGRPPGGVRSWSSVEVRILCMRDIFILGKIWAQDNIYFCRHFDWLNNEACFIV
jgi:hypothetical protein